MTREPRGTRKCGGAVPDAVLDSVPDAVPDTVRAAVSALWVLSSAVSPVLAAHLLRSTLDMALWIAALVPSTAQSDVLAGIGKRNRRLAGRTIQRNAQYAIGRVYEHVVFVVVSLLFCLIVSLPGKQKPKSTPFPPHPLPPKKKENGKLHARKQGARRTAHGARTRRDNRTVKGITERSTQGAMRLLGRSTMDRV